MKYFINLIAVLTLVVLSQNAYSQAGGSNYPNNVSLMAIDEKVTEEITFMQQTLELNSEQITQVENLLLKDELEKIVETNSGLSTVSKVSASLQREDEKDNELKSILTQGQYKIYKLTKHNN